MNFLKQKKLIFMNLVGFLFLTSSYFVLLNLFNQKLNLEFILGFLKPLAVGSIFGIFFSISFLFFPERFFRDWLKHIAWWYILVLVLVSISTPVYSSNILSLDRSQIVFGGMIGLLIITIPYLVWRRRP